MTELSNRTAATVHFDARFLQNPPDGITRFSLGLLTALSKLRPVVALISSPEQARQLPPEVQTLEVNRPTALAELWLGWRLNRAGVQLLFSPMQTTGALGRKFKLVLTLHDLIYYRHRTPPQFLPGLVRIGWRLFHLSYWPQRWLLNRADAVATVSQTTAAEIRRHRLTHRELAVVSNAADAEGYTIPEPDAKFESDADPEAREKTLIYMGSFMGYKNVETLIRAMDLLPDYRLLLLSKISDERRQELLRQAKAARQIEFFNGVSDAEYRELLSRAFALVTASRDEGFGIPVLEAMQLGTPVVCSDLAIFREIAGSSAIFADSESPQEFAAGVKNLESNWPHYSAAARGQAQNFSWQKSAQTLDELLQRVWSPAVG